jgi:hypothetical protein
MRSLALAGLVACAGPRVELPTCTDAGQSLTFAEVPTWSGQVRAVIGQRCTRCHQPDGSGPFSLVDYDDAVAWAAAAAAAVSQRTMPPPGPTSCGECNRFRDHPWLQPEEIAAVRAWAEGGTPAGEHTDPAPVPPDDRLQRVDAVVGMPASYTPDPDQPDDYQCFVLDPELTEDQFLTAFEVQPGDTRVVHHALLYTLPDALVEAEADRRAALDDDVGYDCFGGVGLAGASYAAGWVPGMGATVFPAGTGIKLPAGRKLVLEMHYNLSQGSFPDQSAVAMTLEPEVEQQALLVSYAHLGLTLKPGEQAETASQTFPVYPSLLHQEVVLWGVQPHMHTLGRSLTVETWSTGDEARCVLDVPRYDFDWQGLYFFEQPMRLRADDWLRLTCTYDTRGRAQAVRWGEGTEDEMCLLFGYGTAGVPGE